ncbi:LysR family transcriptional regulator [Glaciecola sp. 2405UD65-10]|uniref:LysR family transcriptional regulator n=1 Tax=Glaciecola sp. 2405UD65-10 TaxID=3397244 RepID=UPI003B5944DA
MKQLSLDVLRSFVTIVDVGNFQRAGEMLGRSQPAISLQIKKLEQQVNKKLFNKVGQGYQVSTDGKWLYEHAKQMLKINDNIFRELSIETLRGRMRLGIPSEFASALLPSIIGEFSQRYPDVSLDVTSALSKHLLSNAQQNKFDLILALLHPTQTPHHENLEILREDELVWVGDKNRNLPTKNLPLVLAPEDCIYRSRVISQLKQQTHAWKINYTNPDFYGLMAAIKQGLGITALAKSIVPDELEIIRDKRLPNLGSINICLLNQDTQHPQVSQTLANYIRARIGVN